MEPRLSSIVSCLLLATATLFVPARLAAEATLLNQWNWNTTTSAQFNLPSAGTVLSGTAAGYGQSAPSAPLSTVLDNGTPSDPGTMIARTTAPIGTFNHNRSATVNPPLLTAANKAVGVMIHAPTTGMNAGEAVKLSWSQTVGFRSSRYWQLLVSTTGTAGVFSAPTGGTGCSISKFVNGYNSATALISGTATVEVSNTGVIDFRTIDGNWISHAVTTTGTLTAPLPAGWVEEITYTLPTGLGYENNPNFAFAIVGAFDPNYVRPVDASPSLGDGVYGLLSSVAGTNSQDLTNGYNRSIGSGGSMRLDLVSVYAIGPDAPPPYTHQQQWRFTNFGSYDSLASAADSADPDGDSLNNLLEYALGLNPNASGTLPASLVLNGANLEYTYTRSTAAKDNGVTYQIEWSDTLEVGSWSTQTVTEQIQGTQEALETVKASIPKGTTGKRFLRLKVQAVSGN